LACPFKISWLEALAVGAEEEVVVGEVELAAAVAAVVVELPSP